MSLVRQIETALGVPENSLFDAIMRLRRLHYSDLAILKIAREAQLYALTHGHSVVVSFCLYVSALTIPNAPQAQPGKIAPAPPDDTTEWPNSKTSE